MSGQLRAKIPEVDKFFQKLNAAQGTQIIFDCLEIKRLKTRVFIKAMKERSTHLEAALHKLLTRNRSAGSSKQKELEQFVMFATDVNHQSYRIFSPELHLSLPAYERSVLRFHDSFSTIKFSQPLTQDQKELIDDLELFVSKATVMGRTISNEAAFPTLESHGEEFATSEYPAQLWIDQWRDFCKKNQVSDVVYSEDEYEDEDDEGKYEAKDEGNDKAAEEINHDDEEEIEDDYDDIDQFNLIYRDWPPQTTAFGIYMGSIDSHWWRPYEKSQKYKNRLNRRSIKELLHLKIYQEEKAEKHPLWSNCNKITSKPWKNAERLLRRIQSIEINERTLKELSESSKSVINISKDVGQNSLAIFMKVQKRECFLRFDDEKITKEETKKVAQQGAKLKNTGKKQTNSQSQETPTSNLSDIMISYNWSSGKDLALRLSGDLKTLGYKVWIDEEEIEVQIHRSMEKAVRNSKIILPLLSKEYEDSTNCLLEFDYAFDIKKRIIPILCQNEYQAKGPVRMKITGLLYFDFSTTGDDDRDKKKYAETFKKLQAQIEKLLKQSI